MERTVIRASRVVEPYGVARGDQPCPMLDLRGHNGVALALPYRLVRSIAFHPGDGITVEFRDHRIVLRGRNLRPLYDHLVDHRITFIQEDDFDAAPETATFVDAIVVERGPEGE